MLNLIVNILLQYSLNKKAAQNITLIAYAILKAKSLFMRQIALYLPTDGLKQSKVNRVWRFFHKLKLSDLRCYKAFVNFILQKVKTTYVIIDFTPLDGYDVKIFFASFPFKGRSIPFYAKVLRQKDIDSMRYKSRNEFIFKCIEEILTILPFKPIIIADREFGFSEFIKFLKTKEVGFIIRLKGDIGIRLTDGKEIKLGELDKGKYSGYLRGELFVKVAVRENKKGKLILAYDSGFISRTTLHMALSYIKRMQCEQYHREIKDRLNLLDLNAVYYREQYEEELIKRYLIVLMFSFILGLFLGKVFVERCKEYLKYVVSEEQELSYLGLAIFLLNSEEKFVPIVLECFKRSLERGWLK